MKKFVYRCLHKESRVQITIDKNNILKALIEKINDLGWKIIKQHSDKPFSFHLNNLKK